MKAGWRWASFEDVVQSRGAGSSGLPQSEWEAEGRFPVIGQGIGEVEGWTNRQDLVVTPEPSLVLFGGHTRRAKHVSMPFVPGPNVKILRPCAGLNSRFLYYYLLHLPIESKGYADHFPLVRKSEVPLPPLPEQRRIVALLDEAFAGLATAAANAERNLDNARELFESHLAEVFSRRGDGWVERRLGQLCEILDSRRKPITKRDRVPGPIPYYGATGIQDYVRDFLFDEALVLVGEDGAKWASGERTAFGVDGKCWVNNHAHVLRPRRDQICDYWLITYLIHLDLTAFVSGLTVPKLTQASLRDIPIPVPPLSEQMQLARTAALLEEQSQRLVGLYEQKQAALAALKRSLLHQAFSGNL